MTNVEIEKLVNNLLSDYCKNNDIDVEIAKETPLIGSNRILDSIGLVNLLVDIETTLLDDDIEVSLTTENAMSARISPYRSVGSLCRFIAQQLEIKTDE